MRTLRGLVSRVDDHDGWLLASVLALCLLGTVINFTVHRVWALGNGEPVMVKVIRYAFVGLATALLNGGGMGLMSQVPGLDYRISWFLVRFFVFMAFYLPLLREFFFPPVLAHPDTLQPNNQP